MPLIAESANPAILSSVNLAPQKKQPAGFSVQRAVN